MFALEISFKDGVSESETLFVRRPHAIIGCSDYAHVVVEDMRALGYQFRLTRDLGRKFRSRAVGADDLNLPPGLEGVFDGEAHFDSGPVSFHVTTLDFDLALKDGETPDSAGVRILRQAFSNPSPLFPAVVVAGSYPMVISFTEGQPILIGRSKQCALRFDSAEISARHARMGFDEGQFWIEDLGSTNGTFVNQQQISGRVNLTAGTAVVLGREISIIGVESEDQIAKAVTFSAPEQPAISAAPGRYPAIVSASEMARPSRVALTPGAAVNLGRDPGSDMWFGAPHVSRRHISLEVSESGVIKVTDFSTNGTAWDGGILKKGDSIDITETPQVFDLGSGVTAAVCFDEVQERMFIAAQGAPQVFSSRVESAQPVESPELAPSERFRGKETVWQPGLLAQRSKLSFFGFVLNYCRSRGVTGWLLLFSLVFVGAVLFAILAVMLLRGLF